MSDMIREIGWSEAERSQWEQFLSREWLVTNGLGGYASGTAAGVPTRRYHGLLVAALRAPFGRTMMFNRLIQRIVLRDGTVVQLGLDEEGETAGTLEGMSFPAEFRLESGLPVWRYELPDAIIEKRILLPHRQNTVFIMYSLLSGSTPLKLRLAPAVNFRMHDAPLQTTVPAPYRLTVFGNRVEISDSSEMPALRMKTHGAGVLTLHGGSVHETYYRAEARRGYEAHGALWTPGHFEFQLTEDNPATVIGSTEGWEAIEAMAPDEAFQSERNRRSLMIAAAAPGAQRGIAAELVLAADQFLITPVGRAEDAARAHAAGEELLTVVAGYHWFTDWGRDTMISLEGLTLATGRRVEAGWILRTFAQYLRDGLVPNMFPEGKNQGLYNTADATLWYFHAIDRYVRLSGDRTLLQFLLPKLLDILEYHIRGTSFGIGMDPEDGLLRQGESGYQLTWMDAKVDDWVVTPRRGKAVEINALWYNALRLTERWISEEQGQGGARRLRDLAARVYQSFNRRFWCRESGYLFDVVDGENGDDIACRPNQIFAISLPHPVLEESHWEAVLETVRRKLLTPVGLRSLAPDHPDYKAKYDGDLRSRDAAYHQGTVWGWLIGPFLDAWVKVHPEDQNPRRFLQDLIPHLDEACVGSMSEIFDAEPPFTPRGCIAQAWTVAEFLRCWLKTAKTGENDLVAAFARPGVENEAK